MGGFAIRRSVGERVAVEAAPVPSHGLPYSLNLTLPPLAIVFIKQEAAEP